MDKSGALSFIHIADVHLGMVPEKDTPLATVRSEEIKSTFSKIIDECDAKKVDLLLVAGDLFHKRPGIGMLREVNYLFGRLSVTRVVLIAGNHDYVREDGVLWDFEWSSNVFFLKGAELRTVCFEDLDTEVTGFSFSERWLKRPVIEEAACRKSHFGKSILIAHGGSPNAAPFSIEGLRGHSYDYVALGHIHQMHEVCENAWFCGSPEPLDRNETGEHGYIYGEIGPKGTRVHFVPFASRSYVKLNLEVSEEDTCGSILDTINGRIASEGKRNMYSVSLKGRRSMNSSFRTVESCLPQCVVHFEDNTEEALDLEQIMLSNRDNILGMYIESILCSGAKDAIADRALILGLEALLKS